jgi:hypothetical protein
MRAAAALSVLGLSAFLALAQCGFQRLADVTLIWNTASARRDPDRIQKFLGDAEIHGLLLRLVFERIGRQIFAVDVGGQIFVENVSG